MFDGSSTDSHGATVASMIHPTFSLHEMWSSVVYVLTSRFSPISPKQRSSHRSTTTASVALKVHTPETCSSRKLTLLPEFPSDQLNRSRIWIQNVKVLDQFFKCSTVCNKQRLIDLRVEPQLRVCRPSTRRELLHLFEIQRVYKESAKALCYVQRNFRVRKKFIDKEDAILHLLAEIQFMTFKDIIEILIVLSDRPVFYQRFNTCHANMYRKERRET